MNRVYLFIYLFVYWGSKTKQNVRKRLKTRARNRLCALAAGGSPAAVLRGMAGPVWVVCKVKAAFLNFFSRFVNAGV